MRTARNKSPQQLFMAGLLLLQNSHPTARDYFEPVDDSYGLDDKGHEPVDNEGSVAVQKLQFQLQPAVLEQLRQRVDPLGLSTNYGIEFYEETLTYIHQNS